jgi:hypothetical protein
VHKVLNRQGNQVRDSILALISVFLAAPQDVELPAPMGLLIKELGESLKVYQCRIANDCAFCTANNIMMQKHCNEVHQKAWINNEITLCEKVKVQPFFQAGGLQRYFVSQNSSQ